MFARQKRTCSDELTIALKEWQAAMKRFDAACGDEVRFAALEVEAAKQKYIFLLNKKRKAAEQPITTLST